jgi:hypothetical protein
VGDGGRRERCLERRGAEETEGVRQFLIARIGQGSVGGQAVDF